MITGSDLLTKEGILYTELRGWHPFCSSQPIVELAAGSIKNILLFLKQPSLKLVDD